MKVEEPKAEEPDQSTAEAEAEVEEAIKNGLQELNNVEPETASSPSNNTGETATEPVEESQAPAPKICQVQKHHQTIWETQNRRHQHLQTIWDQTLPPNNMGETPPNNMGPETPPNNMGPETPPNNMGEPTPNNIRTRNSTKPLNNGGNSTILNL